MTSHRRSWVTIVLLGLQACGSAADREGLGAGGKADNQEMSIDSVEQLEAVTTELFLLQSKSLLSCAQDRGGWLALAPCSPDDAAQQIKPTVDKDRCVSRSAEGTCRAWARQLRVGTRCIRPRSPTDRWWPDVALGDCGDDYAWWAMSYGGQQGQKGWRIHNYALKHLYLKPNGGSVSVQWTKDPWGDPAYAWKLLWQERRCAKWNPGHYLLPTRQWSTQDIEAALAEPGNHLEGIQIYCAWRALEPRKDVYDFSCVQRRVELAATHGKHVFLSVGERTFRDTDEFPVPEYLLTDPEYHGGVEPKVHGGYQARLWDPAVVERINRLMTELGATFDDNVAFEGINFEESVLGIDETTADGYSRQALVDGMLSIIGATVAAFPRSTVLQYMNWGPPEILDLVHELHPAGAGMGGPDLVPDQGRFDYKPRIPAYDHYPTHAGLMPLGTAVQTPNLVRPEWFFEYCPGNPNSPECRQDKAGNYVKRKGDFTLGSFWEMALDTLRLNYVFWAGVGVHATSWEQNRYRYLWADILGEINARQGQIRDACPENHR
jgi:hypothetical protein